MNLILTRPGNLFNAAGSVGNKTFNTLFSKKLYLFFTIFLVSSFAAKASNYYWVGGSGNWSEFATHWATSSGGSTFNTQVPQSTDNVFFDVNSFTAPGQTVTLDIGTAACNDMTWTGAANSPAFDGAGQTLNIYGSLTLTAGMTLTSLNTRFEATTAGKTVTTAGNTMGDITFDGIGGGWTLQDPLTASIVIVNAGSFSTNNLTCNLFQFASDNGNIRSITLGTSVLNISGGGVQIINTTNLTFSGASSTFNILANTNFSTIGLAFNAINFTSSGAFNYGPYIVNTITFGADCSLFRGDN